MNLYKEFIIKTEPLNVEILSGVLWDLNITGLIEDNDEIKVYGKSEVLSGKDIEEVLIHLVSEKLINTFNINENEFPEMNWNEEWEKSLNVIEVSDKIVIKPSFRDYQSKPGQLVLTIDPKMSFGTGEHQTTKLMLLMIEKFVKPGMRVLDVGTGTGVLAIAAVKLGAENALAIDNDEWCYDNGVENCNINSVDDKVKIQTASIEEINQSDFNLVLANINKNILLEIADKIKAKTAKEGIVILSGLLAEDYDDVAARYTEQGLIVINKQKMEEWITIVFKN